MKKAFLVLLLFILTGCTDNSINYAPTIHNSSTSQTEGSVTHPIGIVNSSNFEKGNDTTIKQTGDQTEDSLSNQNYYINTDGEKVHSPAYAPSQPDGATAICNDGTYSFSQHRSGTCSHHGGVAQWL